MASKAPIYGKLTAKISAVPQQRVARVVVLVFQRSCGIYQIEFISYLILLLFAEIAVKGDATTGILGDCKSIIISTCPIF
jgi:hypothetical protein